MGSCVDTETISIGQLPPISSNHDSQLSALSSNGPSTFEEAGNHLGFTHDEAQNLAFGCAPTISPSRILSLVGGPIPHPRYVASHSSPQQIRGNEEYPNITSRSIDPTVSLQPRGSVSLPTASTGLPQLPTCLDPNDAPNQGTIRNETTSSSPGRIGPLTESGLMAFTNRRNGTFRCLVPVEGERCGYCNKKKNRMLSHIRDKHLDQRPWHCGGKCGTRGW